MRSLLSRLRLWLAAQLDEYTLMGRFCFCLCVQVCLLAAGSSYILAADVVGVPKASALPDGVYMVQLLGYVVALLILLGAGLAVLFKKGHFGGGGIVGKAAKKLQIEESKAVGQRQYLLVVGYDGRKMLLGVCPGRIDYLCPLDSDVDAVDESPRSFPKISPEGLA